MIYTSMIFVHE